MRQNIHNTKRGGWMLVSIYSPFYVARTQPADKLIKDDRIINVNNLIVKLFFFR